MSCGCSQGASFTGGAPVRAKKGKSGKSAPKKGEGNETKKELYAKAKKLDILHRSQMNKKELKLAIKKCTK